MKLPLFCVTALLAGVVAASPTTVIPPTFDELVSRAQVIFQGQVASRRSEWQSSSWGPSIVTHVTFGVTNVFKGQAGSTVELKFLGGTIGDTTLTVSDMPQFLVGDRDVLFVSAERGAISPLVGFAYGRYRVVRDAATGVDSVRTYDERLLVGSQIPAQRPLGVLQAPRSMALTEFQLLVRQRVAALGRP